MKISQASLINKFYTVNNNDQTVLTTEVEHINQELYKKSAELAERNKALSLLGAISEIILSSIISIDKIAQQVTSLLVIEAAFQIVCIFTYDKEKNIIRRVGTSNTQTPDPNISTTSLYLTSIPMNLTNNVIIQAITEKQIRFAHSLVNVLFTELEKAQADDIQNKLGVKSVVVFPLVARGQLIGAMVICLSRTEEELLEHQRNFIDRLGKLIGIAMDNAMLINQVQVANEKLKNANESLKQLDKLKNEFVSVASHELRTPMTAIKSYLWMALNGKGGPLNEKQKYYIQRGYDSVNRLVRLVNDMLNISRIESGRITIDLQPVDLIKLTQEVVDDVLANATENGIAITIQKPDLLPLVLADTDKIKEVLFNLIGNSLKFTQRGGAITILYMREGDYIATKVIDTGAGIEPENIGKLFQKFGLLPGSYITNQTAMGTGLGLYICRSIIDLHHGEISATSEGKGKGATFTFTLKEFNEVDIPKKTEDQKEKVGLIHTEI